MRLISDTRDQSHGATLGFGVDENTALVVLNADQASATAEVRFFKPPCMFLAFNSLFQQVLGVGGVFFADLRDAIANDDVINSDLWSIVNVRAAYLTEGDVMNLASGDVTFASWKTSVAGNENLDTAHVSNDIFNGNLDYPLRLPEFPYTASTLFEARLDLLTYGLTWVTKQHEAYNYVRYMCFAQASAHICPLQELTPRFRVWMTKDPQASAVRGVNPRNGREYLSYKQLLVQMEENQVLPKMLNSL